MDLEIKISNFEVEIKPVIRGDQIKAFVTWIFKTDSGDLKVYSGTIRLKAFGKNDKELLTYDPPAIRGRKSYTKVIFMDNLDLYKRLCSYTLEKYYEASGELPNEVSLDEDEFEEIN